MSWFDGKKGWFAGALAGVAGLIGVERGLQTPLHEKKTPDASAQTTSDAKEWENARAESARKIAEARSHEKDLEDIKKVKELLSKMEAPAEEVDEETELKSAIPQEEFARKLEALEKGRKIVEELKRRLNVEGELSPDGKKLLVGRAVGNDGVVDPFEQVNVDISNPAMMVVENVSFMDGNSPVAWDDSEGLARIVQNKIELIDMVNNLGVNNRLYTDEGKEQLRNFITEHGLVVEEKNYSGKAPEIDPNDPFAPHE